MSCICRIFNKTTGRIQISDSENSKTTAKYLPTETFNQIADNSFVSSSSTTAEIPDFKQYHTIQSKQNINTSSTQNTLITINQNNLEIHENNNNIKISKLTNNQLNDVIIKNDKSSESENIITETKITENLTLNTNNNNLNQNSIQLNQINYENQLNLELNSNNIEIVSNFNEILTNNLNLNEIENVNENETKLNNNKEILNENSSFENKISYIEINNDKLNNKLYLNTPQNSENNLTNIPLNNNIEQNYVEDLNVAKHMLLDIELKQPKLDEDNKNLNNFISNGNLKYINKLELNSTNIIINNDENLIEILPNYDFNRKYSDDNLSNVSINLENLNNNLNINNKKNKILFKSKNKLKFEESNQILNNNEDRDSGVHENEIPKESTITRISIKQDNEQQKQQTIQDKQQKRLGFIFNRTKLFDNKKDDIIPTHKKDENTRKLIRKAIENNDFLNNYMDDERKERVIDAMELMEYDKGKFIIRQNEEGSEIYVSEDGAFDVIKNNEYIDTLGNGIVFGELAILYNAKRFVSIKTASKAKVWKIDRDKFRKIMLISGHKERDENLNFLRSAKYLNDLEEDILLKVVDLLKRVFYPTDCCIVAQGDIGNDFFIIRGGTVTIKKTNEYGEERIVDRREKGQYFGEQALLNAECRQASVYADAPGTECLKLDRESFISYLGTIPELREKPIEREILNEIRKSTILNNIYDHIEFDDLKKVGTLGAGAFGKVELVLYKEKQSFALKTIKKIDILKQGQIDHIYNEKKVMSLSHSSPFIVELYRTYRDSKYVYFLMEACLGGDVWTILYQRKFFDEKTSKFISGCVIEAFDYLHTRNIIYRDLKPENLMLTTDGYCKLVDFGFAKVLNPNHKTNTFAGTPEYVAPEIILDRGHDRAIDYWALGCLIFELLSGGTPFRGTNQMKIYQKILGGIEIVKFPQRIQKQAQNLIRHLCRQIPAERLGYQKKGIMDIKSHSWYNGFDWYRLQNRSIISPIPRPTTGLSDTQYFPYCNSQSDQDVPPDEISGWDINF